MARHAHQRFWDDMRLARYLLGKPDIYIYLEGGKVRKHRKALRLKRVIAYLWKHKKTILKIVLFIIKIADILFRNGDD